MDTAKIGKAPALVVEWQARDGYIPTEDAAALVSIEQRSISRMCLREPDKFPSRKIRRWVFVHRDSLLKEFGMAPEEDVKGKRR